MSGTIAAGLLCSLFLFTMSACDGDSTGGDENVPSQQATFVASVTGDVEVEVTGTAFSGVVGTTWGLTLTVTSSKGGYSAITFLRGGGVRPDNGTYSVGPVSQESADFTVGATIDNVGFSGTSGSVEVTSSSETNVRGTFQISATAGTVGNPVNVTVTGGFNATNHISL